MDERYVHVLNLLKSHKDLLDYIAKRLLEKESMEGKEFESIVKAESHCEELAAEAGKKSEEDKYVNASAVQSAAKEESLALPEVSKPRRTRKAKAEPKENDEKPKKRGRKPKSES